MSRLQPPIIEGVLPAFYGTLLTVPFQMNRSVSKSQIKGFNIKIKTSSNSRLIYSSGIQTQNDGSDLVIDWDKLTLTFAIDNADLFKVGSYYKIQIAYVDHDGITGHFSPVGVAKYTTEPSVYIENMNIEKNNLHLHTYTGVYSQEGGDATEKLYSSKFNLYDKTRKLIYTTGERLHNSSVDDLPNVAIELVNIAQDLLQDEKFYLEFEVLTNNKMKYTSPSYTVVQKIPFNPEFNFTISANAPYGENGCIDIYLHEVSPTKVASGSFKLLRADSKTNFTEWNEILDFKFYNEKPDCKLFTDYTLEQGVSYKYAIVQYSKYNLLSNRIETDAIQAHFEFAYLFDGKRQLKIKYNPKMNSFKNVRLEAKVDTIGGKHPFIFRNGNVDYKEFPVSGLISWLSDEDNLFFNIQTPKKLERGGKETYTPKDNGIYSIDNVKNERDFKMEVLAWLNNGEPKLFRSPTEGNYIVRLLNSSLSPVDQLGRLLHSFSSTAYEIADCNFKTLYSYGFFGEGRKERKVLGWECIDVNKALAEGRTNLINYKAQSLKLEDFVPGELVYINNGVKRQDPLTGKVEIGQHIVIGATGNYVLDLGDQIEISEVRVEHAENRPVDSIITYSYYKNANSDFDLVKSMEIVDEPIRQIYGPVETKEDFVAMFNDVKSSNQKIYFLRAVCLPYGDDEARDPEDTKLYINEQEIDLSQTGYRYIKDPQTFDIHFGSKILVEVCSQLCFITYELEETIPNLAGLKQDYEAELKKIDEIIYSGDESGLDAAIAATETAYSNFIEALENELKERGVKIGEIV